MKLSPFPSRNSQVDVADTPQSDQLSRATPFLLVLLLTWFVCMSTAVAVLGRNVAEFYPTLGLLVPNLITFGAAAAVAIVVARVARRMVVRVSLPATAAAFVGLSLEGRLSVWGTVGTILLAAGITAFITRNISAQRLRTYALACLVLLVTSDSLTLAYLIGRVPDSQVSADVIHRDPTRAPLPNIYHFVFDAFQSDVFADLIDRGDGPHLGGFTFFENTASVFPSTAEALATMFSWRKTEELFSASGSPSMTKEAFFKEAHSAERSLKSRLRGSGYTTSGYSYYSSDNYPFLNEGFDNFTTHIAYVEESPMLLDDRDLFFNLWLVSILPQRIASLVVPNVVAEQLLSQGTLSRLASLVSYAAVKKLLGEEYRKPEHSHYTFFHLLFPHKPFIMTPECTVYEDDPGDTPEPPRVEHQYQCSLRLIDDIVRTLKRLGRFNPSMIIFQSDHGDGIEFGPDGGYWRREPPPPDTLTKALMLVKWPGDSDVTPLRRTEVPVRTSDVTRTILSVAGDSAEDVQGVDLRKPAGVQARARYFYVEQDRHFTAYAIDSTGRIQPSGTRSAW